MPEASARLQFSIREAHLGIAAREDFLLWVVQFEFHQEGPGIRGHHARGADHLGRKRTAGKFRNGHLGGLAESDASGHCLGNLHEIREAFVFAPGGRVPSDAGDDEISRIDIADRDGAGKRSCHPGKRLDLLQPAHLGAGRFGDGRFELEVGLFLGVILFADAGGLQQFGPARRSILDNPNAASAWANWPWARSIPDELRRVDLGQKLACLDVGADVHEPALR